MITQYLILGKMPGFDLLHHIIVSVFLQLATTVEGGGYCADLSTSVNFGTDVDHNILIHFRGRRSGRSLWPPFCQIQDGR